MEYTENLSEPENLEDKYYVVVFLLLLVKRNSILEFELDGARVVNTSFKCVVLYW